MEQSDAELAARSNQGDLTAFNQIVDRFQSQVYNTAARILGDRTTAEDITQETFVSAYRAIGRFRGGSLRAWLLRIATNHCYDLIRASKRRREDSLDQAMENPSFALPPGEATPEQMALSGELSAIIQSAILRLPPDQGLTLVLVDVQGLSYEEAADATGAKVGTVRSRLSRARSGVRDLLLEHRELLPDRFRQSIQGGTL